MTSEVEQVVLQLYENPDTYVKKNAHEWLLEFQKSPQAWQTSFDILSSKYTEAQYFGAQTLQFKINREWDTLDNGKKDVLKNELLQRAAEFSKGPSIVLTRLCICISTVAIQTYPHQWTNMISDVFESFQNYSTNKGLDTRPALLEFLIVLPEEIRSANFTAQRKKIVDESLSQNVVQIMSLLTSFLSTPTNEPSYDHEIKRRALKGIQSWISFGVPIEELKPAIPFVLSSLDNLHHFEIAIDVLVEFVSNPKNAKHGTTVCSLIPFLVSRHQELVKAINEGDESWALGMCRLLVGIGESFTPYLFSNFTSSPEIQEFFSMILECTNYPGYYPLEQEISPIPLNFWYLITECCLDAHDNINQEALGPIWSLLQNLTRILCTKCEYPPDSEFSSWTKEHKDTFSNYRRDLGDTLIFITNILKGNMTLFITEILKNQLQSSYTWHSIEALLYSLRMVSEGMDPEEMLGVEDFFNIIFQLPNIVSHPRINYTCLLLIGSYSPWLKDHNEFLNQSLQLVLSGFQFPDLSPPAAIALKDITEVCGELLSSSINSFIQCFSELKPHVKVKERVMFINSIGFILQTLPPEAMTEPLFKLAQGNLHSLETTLNNVNESNHLLSRGRLIADTRQLTALFTNLKSTEFTNGSHPLQPILQKILPCLERVVSIWIQDEEVMTSVCDLLEYVIRTMENSLAPHFSTICNLLVEGFQYHPQPRFLSTAGVFAGNFGSMGDSYVKPLAQLLQRMSNNTFLSLQSNFSGQPELIIEYFGLLNRYVRNCPNSLFDPEFGVLPNAFQLVVSAFTLQEKEPVQAAANFFGEFVEKDFEQKYKELAKTFVFQTGEPIVHESLLAIGGRLPRSSVQFFAVLLFKFRHAYPDFLKVCLEKVLAQPQFPSEHIQDEDKIQFLQNVFGIRHQSQFKEMIREFSLKARNLQNTTF